MICIIAGNYKEAQNFAYAQNWSLSEWFFPASEFDLHKMSNFHVLVIGSAGENIPSHYFERVYALARERGKIGRQ